MTIVNFIGIILVFIIQSAVCEQNDSGSDDKLIFANIVSLERACLFALKLFKVFF